MPTRNVILTDQQTALIEDLVRSGRYQSASEVLREGLRALERRESVEAAKREGLRAALAEAEEAIGAGDVYPYTADLLREIDREERHHAAG